jgi:hypothetical protein
VSKTPKFDAEHKRQMKGKDSYRDRADSWARLARELELELAEARELLDAIGKWLLKNKGGGDE